jgi:hypothetical protein
MQVAPETANEYHLKAEQLTTAINSAITKRPDIQNLVGEHNIEMMKDNHSNHVRFISSILKNYNPEVMVDTILWVFRAYRSHGFTTNYWAAQLNTWHTVIKDVLSAKCYAEVYPYYEWMQVNIPIFVKVSDEKLEVPNSLH